MKLPQLFTEIANRHFVNGVIPQDFDYELITDDKEKFAIKTYVCEESKIKEV